MFAQCMNGDHDKCQGVLSGSRYHIVCDCPHHAGQKVPENACSRCHGSGYHGPVSVESGICFRCGGTGEEPEAPGLRVERKAA